MEARLGCRSLFIGVDRVVLVAFCEHMTRIWHWGLASWRLGVCVYWGLLRSLCSTLSGTIILWKPSSSSSWSLWSSCISSISILIIFSSIVVFRIVFKAVNNSRAISHLLRTHRRTGPGPWKATVAGLKLQGFLEGSWVFLSESVFGPRLPLLISKDPEGPYTLPMELGPQKTIPILVLGT